MRNRERLLTVAKHVFLEAGPTASLDQIAKRAGVGIGTLYRHFPTRSAIVEALYRHEVDAMVEAAHQLAETRTPIEALREWLRVFIGYIATKRFIGSLLDNCESDKPAIYASSSQQTKNAIAMLVDRAVAAGEIRLDMEPLDLLRALSGVVDTDGVRDWEPSARRLIDVMIEGMRTP